MPICLHSGYCRSNQQRRGRTSGYTRDRQTNIVRRAGAGDSFNGGYIRASLGDLPIKQRLAMANAITACFMTQGTGLNKGQLIAQIEKTTDK